MNARRNRLVFRTRKPLLVEPLEDRNAPGETFGSLLWSPWTLAASGTATEPADVPLNMARPADKISSQTDTTLLPPSPDYTDVSMNNRSSPATVSVTGTTPTALKSTADLDALYSPAPSAPMLFDGLANPLPTKPVEPAVIAAPLSVGTSSPLVTVPTDPAIDINPHLTFTPDGKPSGGGNFTGYTPAQIRHAYGFDNLTGTGKGQTIAIIDAFDDPNITSDLNTFSKQFGLPQTKDGTFTFSVAYAGGTKPLPDVGWAEEMSLDVEWAHAIAPNANILLVEATTNGFTDMYAAVDYAVAQGANVVSMSWSAPDGSGDGDVAYDKHFNVSGVTFVAASGDSLHSVGYPAASPYVVSVGGTTLTLDTQNNRSTETAWTGSNGLGSGGGVSAIEPEPTYQTSFPLSLSGRGTPDVAYDADPNTGVRIYDSYGFRAKAAWFPIGGTSVGTPEWAALIALANAGRSTTPLSTSLTMSPVYTAATGMTNGMTNYSINYFDVMSGSYAGPGYDQATGLGSPKADKLVPFLTGL
jgi:subtilase family serine protease